MDAYNTDMKAKLFLKILGVFGIDGYVVMIKRRDKPTYYWIYGRVV